MIYVITKNTLLLQPKNLSSRSGCGWFFSCTTHIANLEFIFSFYKTMERVNYGAWSSKLYFFYGRINLGAFILHSIVSLGRGFSIQDVITYCSHQPIQL